ncbi:MAG TPA: tryptophan--tRNA ligase, partial [Saprospiraceae bacterium]|nr:tryptophan--tRNA ligase [Saprospiraceae bacterium]
VTDTGDTPAGEMSAGVRNLFALLRACDQTATFQSLMADYEAGALKYVDLKEAVAEALVAVSAPMRDRKAAIDAHKKEVKEQIKASSAQVRRRAQETIREVKELAGLLNVKF